MFRKRAPQEGLETPHRSLEAEVGVPETVIAHGATVRGTIQGRTSVHLAGLFEGEIKVEGWVCIEKQGEVQGTVKAVKVTIEGKVKGDIDCSEKIELRASARVIGNLRCKTLVTAEGCFFQGQIKMPGEGSQSQASMEKTRTTRKRVIESG